MDITLGCLNADTVMVFDNSLLPVADIDILETFTCLDSVAMLDIGTSDTGTDITYEWNGPSTNGVDALVIEPTQPGVYNLTVVNQSTGCEATASVILALPITPEGIGVDITPPLCEGGFQGSLLITGVTGGTPVYMYSFQGDTLTSLTFF